VIIVINFLLKAGVYFHENLTTLGLSTAQVIDNTVINLDSLTSVVAGQLFCMKESNRYYQGKILSVSTATTSITLDTPIDYAYSTSADVHNANFNMAIDASSTQAIFHIAPPSTAKWDITRIIFYIEAASTTMNDTLFGTSTAVVNGVVVRHVNSQTYNIFNVKSNGEFAQRAFDRTYNTDGRAGTGISSVIIRRTFNGPEKNGVVIRIDGNLGDEFQILLNDNISANSDFYALAQGHWVVG
jgi:hypothetical protein